MSWSAKIDSQEGAYRPIPTAFFLRPVFMSGLEKEVHVELQESLNYNGFGFLQFAHKLTGIRPAL